MAASAISYKKYEIRQRNPNPNSAALLVIDMQNHFSSIANPILALLYLLPDIGRRDEDRVVEKNTYSAFEGTGLELMLRDLKVEEVIVTGVMTNLCCETTAREAFVKGFRVFFSTDATGTLNGDLHEATVKNMAYGFAYLVDCSSLKAALLSDK